MLWPQHLLELLQTFFTQRLGIGRCSELPLPQLAFVLCNYWVSRAQELRQTSSVLAEWACRAAHQAKLRRWPPWFSTEPLAGPLEPIAPRGQPALPGSCLLQLPILARTRASLFLEGAVDFGSYPSSDFAGQPALEH
jgi:hypothetical protein